MARLFRPLFELILVVAVFILGAQNRYYRSQLQQKDERISTLTRALSAPVVPAAPPAAAKGP